MIRVCVEVCSGTARFRAAVWVESIERALSLIRAQYPGGEAKVIFPIEPFFVGENMPISEVIASRRQKRLPGEDSCVADSELGATLYPYRT